MGYDDFFQRHWANKRAAGIKEKAISDKQKRAKDWLRDYRMHAIQALGGKCASCGCDEAGVLQFDHIQPVQRQKTNNPGYTSPGYVVKNKDQFQLLCENCHMKKTRLDLQSMSRERNGPYRRKNA